MKISPMYCFIITACMTTRYDHAIGGDSYHFAWSLPFSADERRTRLILADAPVRHQPRITCQFH